MDLHRNKKRHACILRIGELRFKEDHCVIDGDGSKHLVFVARRGFRRVRVRIPEGSWVVQGRGELRLADDSRGAQLASALMSI